MTVTKIDARALDSFSEVVQLEVALCKVGIEWAKAAEKAEVAIGKHQAAERALGLADAAWKQALRSVQGRDPALSDKLFRIGHELTGDMIEGGGGLIRDVVRAAEAIRKAKVEERKVGADAQAPVAARNQAMGEVLRAKDAVLSRAHNEEFSEFSAWWRRLLAGIEAQDRPDWRSARELFGARLGTLS